MAWLVKREHYRLGEWYLQCLGFAMIVALLFGARGHIETRVLEEFFPWLNPEGIPAQLVATVVKSITYFPGWLGVELWFINRKLKRERAQKTPADDPQQ